MILTDAERHGIRTEDLRGIFLLLGQSLINKEIELPLFEKDEEVPKFNGLRAMIFGLLKEIVDPHVPFAAASNRENSRPKYGFQHIC